MEPLRPVGVDQVPHVEITREIARRFNYLYGEVFPEPEAILTQTPKILGHDRRKMSKSYNNAIYLADSVDRNDGTTPHAVTVEDVPVHAFWSVTVYDADGYLAANDLGRNSYNNITAAPNEDGSITIHFGGCGDDRTNCIPTTPGWSYLVRLYEPGPEILDGSWTFPKPQPTS